jgi:hypothetical protein
VKLLPLRGSDFLGAAANLSSLRVLSTFVVKFFFQFKTWRLGALAVQSGGQPKD